MMFLFSTLLSCAAHFSLYDSDDDDCGIGGLPLNSPTGAQSTAIAAISEIASPSYRSTKMGRVQLQTISHDSVSPTGRH